MADNPITDDNNVVLYDDLGNKIGAVLKNGIYRLEQRGIITSPDGTKDVTVTTDGAKERLDVHTQEPVQTKDVGQQYSDDGFLYISIIDELNLGTGANEKDVFLVKNPVSSGVEVKIEEYVFVTAKVSQALVVRMYKNPTITADGTALAEVNKGNLATTGDATSFMSPTISARGTKVGIYGIEGAGGTRFIEQFTLKVEEGEELLITVEQQSANQVISMSTTWAEIPI